LAGGNAIELLGDVAQGASVDRLTNCGYNRLRMTRATRAMVQNYEPMEEMSFSSKPDETTTRTYPNGWSLLMNGRSS